MITMWIYWDYFLYSSLPNSINMYNSNEHLSAYCVLISVLDIKDIEMKLAWFLPYRSLQGKSDRNVNKCL